MNEYLKSDMDVFGIDCNVGSFAMSVAPKVHFITGIEHEKASKYSGKDKEVYGLR